jgi:hypothetical protein
LLGHTAILYIGSSSSSAPNSSSRSVVSRLPQGDSRRIGSMDGVVGPSGGGGVIPGIAGPSGVGRGATGFRTGAAARLMRPAPALAFVAVPRPFRADRAARPRTVRFTRRRGPVRARSLRPVRFFAIPRPSHSRHTQISRTLAFAACVRRVSQFSFLWGLFSGQEFPPAQRICGPVLRGLVGFRPSQHASQHDVGAPIGAVDCGSPAGLFFFLSRLPDS